MDILEDLKALFWLPATHDVIDVAEDFKVLHLLEGTIFYICLKVLLLHLLEDTICLKALFLTPGMSIDEAMKPLFLGNGNGNGIRPSEEELNKICRRLFSDSEE